MNRLMFVRSVLALTLAVGLLGCASSRQEEERGTKVLMIGNIFSICLLQHLPSVAKELGVELDLASLYIGGCSLERHCKNVEKEERAKANDDAVRPYRFGRNRFGKYTERKLGVCAALRLAKWDIVTIQQASHESWKPETFEPWGDKLIAKIRELAPQAKIVVQETWSYTPWDKRLQKWGIDQDEMYEKLHAAYGSFAKKRGLGVIPFGTAVQEWRRRLPVKYEDNSFGGDVVGGGNLEPKDHFKRAADNSWVPNCDVFHLGRRGTYFQALVWANALFDEDLTNLEYRPTFVTEDEAKLMKEIAVEIELK